MALASLISPDLTVRIVASSLVHTLVVLMCGAKTGMIEMGRLYAVHDHVLGGDAERGVFAAEISHSTKGLYFPGERPFGLPR